MANAAQQTNVVQFNHRRTATDLIEIKKKLDVLEAQAKPLKAALVKDAGGANLTIEVPGKGIVMVTAASEPKPTGKVFQLDAAKFEALSDRQKRRLRELGVVSEVETFSRGATASVRITPNV